MLPVMKETGETHVTIRRLPDESWTAAFAKQHMTALIVGPPQ